MPAGPIKVTIEFRDVPPDVLAVLFGVTPTDLTPRPGNEETRSTYVDDAIAEINRELPGLPPALARLYAILALTTETATRLRDVHDAWCVWKLPLNPDHPAIVPFDRLTPEVQELDRAYAEGIHRAARTIRLGRGPGLSSSETRGKE